MRVINNNALEYHELPGLTHQTLGGINQGLKGMEVWFQTMESGAATPVHSHDCEEVIIILSGSGSCRSGGQTLSFHENATIILEPGITHQIVNTSDVSMKLIAILGMAPVQVKDTEGLRLPLPWDTVAG